MTGRRFWLAAGLLASFFLVTSRPARGDEIKSAVDRAIRWLSSEENEDGSFGSGEDRCRVTAAVLAAYAQSPRQYREDDGPFVRRPLRFLLAQQNADGTFGPVETAPMATGLMIQALEALGAERHRSALQRAEKALAGNDATDGVSRYFAWVDLPADSEAWARGHSEVQQLLGSQFENGAWGREGSQEPSVARTAGAALLLSIAYRTPSDAAARESAQERAREALAGGVAYLLSQQEDGKWTIQGEPDLGLTGMAVTAVAMSPERPEESEDAISQALDFIRSQAKPDGGIHQGQVQNYVTCVSIMALKEAGSPEDEKLISRAANYVRALQTGGDQGYEPDDKFYGGIGYGGDQRPDLSNLQFALEALRASGASAEDQAIQDALVFLQRCQNRSESNPNPVDTADGKTVRPGNDGGAMYYPGDSPAGYEKNPDGTYTARSYGSMTYALLRGYLFAGLSPDDPRVQDAVDWISRHYTVEYNPGFETLKNSRLAYQGLFYYYLTMAKALAALEKDAIVDASGEEQDWRSDLIGKLASLQNENGSWLNENAERWWEGNPVLATAYAVQTLAICLEPREQREQSSPNGGNRR